MHCLKWLLACCCFHAVQHSPPLRGLAQAQNPAAGHGVPSLATGCGWSVSLHCATAPWLAHVAACDADYCSGGCLSSRPAASAPSLHLSERQPAGPSLAEDQGAASRCEMQALRACWSRCTTPADFAPMRVAWVKGVIALAGFCVRSRMDTKPNNLANSQRHVEAAHRCLCSRCGAGLRGDTRRGRGPAASFRTVQRSLNQAPLGQPRRTTYSLSLHCLWPLSPASTPVFGSGAAVFRAMLGAFLFSLQARLQETGMFSDNACIASALTCCVC